MKRSLAAAVIVAVAAAPLVYDGAGRLTSRTDPAGAHAFTWTARGELDTATDPLTGAAIDHDWDAASQLDAITYGAGAAAPVRDRT